MKKLSIFESDNKVLASDTNSDGSKWSVVKRGRKYFILIDDEEYEFHEEYDVKEEIESLVNMLNDEIIDDKKTFIDTILPYTTSM